MLLSFRLAPFVMLASLAASIFAVFVLVAAEAEADPSGLNDWSESLNSTKLSALTHSSSQRFWTVAAENIGASAARVGKENDHTHYERRAFADEASSSAAIPHRPVLSSSRAKKGSKKTDKAKLPGSKFSVPWFPGQSIRKRPEGMRQFGAFTTFMEDVLVTAAKSGSDECKAAVGTLDSTNLGQIKSRGHYRRLTLKFLACGIAPRDFVAITKTDLENAKGDDRTVKRAKSIMAKNFIDKAFEEYIKQIIQPENLQKLYETELQLRGRHEMVEVTSLPEFEQKTKLKLKTADREKIYCDVLQVIRPVYEGWKAIESEAYGRFKNDLKGGTFTGNLADYFARDKVSRYSEEWLAIRKEIEEKAKEKKQAGKKAIVEAESTESSFSEAPETSKGKKRKRPSPYDPEGKHSDTANKGKKKRKEEERGSYKKSNVLMAEEYLRLAKAKGEEVQLDHVKVMANRFYPSFAKRLHGCDLRPLSKMALPDPENKIACQEYVKEVIRDWREAHRNRFLYKWGVLRPALGYSLSSWSSTPTSDFTGWSIGQPNAEVFKRKAKGRESAERPSLPIRLALLLGTSRQAVVGWLWADPESYKRLLQDMKDGKYTHNPFDYMKPEEYLKYETMGKWKDDNKNRAEKERGWDYNQPPPKEKDPSSLLSHFEEECERLKQRTPSSSTPNADGPGTSVLQPTLPSLLLTDPPYFGPDTLSPKIEERPSYAAAVPTEILPRPRMIVSASKPTDSLTSASS